MDDFLLYHLKVFLKTEIFMGFLNFKIAFVSFLYFATSEVFY